MGVLVAILLLVILLPLALLAWWAVAVVAPFLNENVFGLIWRDPTERQRVEVLRRLQELHLDGGVPDETAVLMAAKERLSTERDLIQVAGAFSLSDLMGVLSGRRGFVGTLFGAADRTLRKGHGRRRR